MTIREAIRAKQRQMRERSPQARRAYFWEYHKAAVIALAVALLACILVAVDVFGKKDVAFHGMFLNAEERQSGQLIADFAKAIGIDPEKEEIKLDSALKISQNANSTEDLYGIQSLVTRISAGAIDTVACDGELLISFGYLGYLADLRQVLTAQELERLDGSLLYVDQAVLDALSEAALDPEGVLQDYPDPGKPDTMEDPVPVGILLNGALDGAFRFSGGAAAIGVTATTNRMETCQVFLRLVLAQDGAAAPQEARPAPFRIRSCRPLPA